MTARIVRLAVFVLIMVGSAGSLRAEWCDGITEFFRSIPRDFKRRQCWPEPFTAPDRASIRAPFAVMVNNGWRRQNLLGDYYFDPNTGKLNEAGERKVRWILTEAPEQHRIVYVHVAATEDATAARLVAVHDIAAKWTPQGTSIPILPTAISDEGSPASQVEMISRSYQKSIPTPRLPAPQDTVGSSSGGGN